MVFRLFRTASAAAGLERSGKGAARGTVRRFSFLRKVRREQRVSTNYQL